MIHWKILSNISIFKGIEPSLLQEIEEQCATQFFDEQTTIFKEWDVSNGEAYVLLDGNMRVIIGNETIAQVQVGSIVGEYALIREENRSATVITNTECECLVIEQELLMSVLDSSENLTEIVMERILENAKHSRGIFGEE
jgi:CRP-like cAMP-binding protein